MKSIIPASLSAAAALAIAIAPAFAADPISGQWVTQDKEAVVTISNCGNSVCGKITRFLVPPPGGADQRDIHNPDKSLRSRKLMGLSVLSGFSEDGDQWRGEIYDPKTGKTYRSVIQRKGANKLEVKGCVAIFCQTQVWTRP